MLRRLGTTIESIAAALLIAAVTLNFANVLARYVFNRPIVTAEEILQYANVWIVMLAGAAVTRLGIHLRMDLLPYAPGSRIRRAIEVIIVLLGIGLAGFVVVNALQVVSLTYNVGQRSVATGIPLALVYLAVPFGFGCTFVFLVHHAWRLVRGVPDDTDKTVDTPQAQ